MSECPVCLEDMVETITVTPPCKHSVCLSCLLQTADRRCALCRRDLSQHFPRRRHRPTDADPLGLAQAPGWVPWMSQIEVTLPNSVHLDYGHDSPPLGGSYPDAIDHWT